MHCRGLNLAEFPQVAELARRQGIKNPPRLLPYSARLEMSQLVASFKDKGHALPPSCMLYPVNLIQLGPPSQLQETTQAGKCFSPPYRDILP